MTAMATPHLVIRCSWLPRRGRVWLVPLALRVAWRILRSLRVG